MHIPPTSSVVSLSLVPLAAALLLVGCATADVPVSGPSEAQLLRAEAAVQRYVDAVAGSGAASHLGPLSVYIDDFGGARPGEDLPPICLEVERESLLSLGVSLGSTVEIMVIGGTEITFAGTDTVLDYPQMLVGQMGIDGGGTEGRGVVQFVDSSRMQIQPSEGCDEALGLGASQ